MRKKKKRVKKKTTLNIKAKKSRRLSLNHQLVASSQPLSTTTAQNFMSFSHNPNPITHYRASLGSTSFSQSTSLQQLMTHIKKLDKKALLSIIITFFEVLPCIFHALLGEKMEENLLADRKTDSKRVWR